MSFPKILSSLSLVAGVASFAVAFIWYIYPDLNGPDFLGDVIMVKGGLFAIISGLVAILFNQNLYRKIALSGVILGVLSYVVLFFSIGEMFKSSM